MTLISKPVSRLTRAVIRDAGQSRPIVVVLAADGLYLRQKGRRTAYHLPYEAAYHAGARMAAEVKRREKLAAKKGKVQS